MEIKKYPLEPNPREIKMADDTEDIFISVTIGNGQIGGNKVKSNGNLLAKGKLSNPTFIGSKLNSTGKTIEVETNVLDVNSFTNLCVITTTFTNQDNKILFAKTDKGEAPENGVASFTAKYLLKLFTAAFIFFTVSVANLFSQSDEDDVTFQSLETPSSPGFILMDQAPSAIERPTTPQGFGISALGFFQGTGGAMEFSPFWLISHPDLTAKDMYSSNIPLLRNFSISAAYTKSENSNFLTGGFRTRFYQVYKEDITERLDSIEIAIIDELSGDLNLEKIEELRQQYVGIIERPVFTIDLAAAIGGVDTTNSYENIEPTKWAVWISANWRPGGDDFYASILGRYSKNDKFKSYLPNTDLIDVGARINYDIDKFCLSMEYLQRLNITENKFDDYRIAIIGSYQLSDNIYITSTFGKNFTDVNNIIALGGINFGFSQTKIKAFD